MYASNLVGRKYKRRSWVQDKYFFLRGLSTRKCVKSVSQETEKLHIVLSNPYPLDIIQSLPWLSVSPSVAPHFELCLNCRICQNCYIVDTCIVHVFVTLNRHFLFASLQEFQSAFFSIF